ncbi:MAG: HNH endonuclease [Candidatus Acidiferrales bacterium]
MQRGMNFRLRNEISVLLMSVRRGAPYEDRLLEDGRVLIYEGHDAHRIAGGPAPKECDQPEQTPKGKPTQNALFFKAAVRFKTGKGNAEQVRVYEKIRDGIWVFNGVFRLVDAWKEKQGARTVFKFRLAISKQTRVSRRELRDLSHVRMIPSAVKLEVWKRDRGRCVKCGRQENLHFDHDLPFSRGGTSLLARNIQLLCARHNLAKKNRIE